MSWKVLKTEQDYQTALKRTMEIFHAEEGNESDELDLLLVLIKDYEDKHIHVPQLTPAQLYKTKLIEQRGLFRSSHVSARTVSGATTVQLYRNKTVVIGLNGRKNSAMPSYRFAVRLKK